MKIADYVFETSWEICNKVGGIYTVLSTKAFTAVNHYKDNYICLGPDLSKEQNNDFIEDSSLFKNWRDFASSEGLKFRVGRWDIAGSPIVILVDFTPFFEKKNEILTHFWLRYKLDSIAGQWVMLNPHCSVTQLGALSKVFTSFIAVLMTKLLRIFTNG
jgi:phosphorylase/glycogen(starch) synthase